jgi:ABC-2 type transport system permease protein
MEFLRQIKFEIRNIFKSKFILIIGIIVMAYSIGLPIFNVITKNSEQAYPGGPIIYSSRAYAAAAAYDKMMPYPGGDPNQQPITVGDQTIAPENPFYWQINNAMQEKAMITTDKGGYKTPQAIDLAISMMDMEIAYYARLAKSITKPQDYRMDFAYNDKIYDKFIFEHTDVPVDVLMDGVKNRGKGYDEETFKKQYIDITPAEKMAALDKIDTYLNDVYSMVENNDFAKYIDLSIQRANDDIKNLNDQIAIQEQAIIDNPTQEESLNQMIEDMKKQIQFIQTSRIPTLQYRLEKHIVPNEDVWQNSALSDIENNQQQLMYTVIKSEADFNKDLGLVQEYTTYARYTAMMQAQIDDLNNTILIAQKSLDADKPDMKYVYDGARIKTTQFLNFSIIIALFAILLGGWLMASEFQQGTIRLLMIRPKTRVKILMSKFTGALLICIAMYLAGSILNMIVNGICFGFSDFAFPNYMASGEIGFFAYYVPKLIACFVPIIFAYTVAFMLSVLSKNVAVAIAVPVVCFIASSIGMATLSHARIMEWTAWTPLPYVDISAFFMQYSSVTELIKRGLPLSLTYGIILMMVLAAICTFVSVWVFRKRDITN